MVVSGLQVEFKELALAYCLTENTTPVISVMFDIIGNNEVGGPLKLEEVTRRISSRIKL